MSEDCHNSTNFITLAQTTTSEPTCGICGVCESWHPRTGCDQWTPVPAQPEVDLVCVLCGDPWEGFKNRCQCGGFCTWGPAKGAQRSSWNEDGSPKAPPADTPPAVPAQVAAPSDYERGFNDCRDKALYIVEEHDGFSTRIELLQPAAQPVIPEPPEPKDAHSYSASEVRQYVQKMESALRAARADRDRVADNLANCEDAFTAETDALQAEREARKQEAEALRKIDAYLQRRSHQYMIELSPIQSMVTAALALSKPVSEKQS